MHSAMRVIQCSLVATATLLCTSLLPLEHFRSRDGFIRKIGFYGNAVRAVSNGTASFELTYSIIAGFPVHLIHNIFRMLSIFSILFRFPSTSVTVQLESLSRLLRQFHFHLPTSKKPSKRCFQMHCNLAKTLQYEYLTGVLHTRS